jgi:glycosyltransferase involved in cell wall biosynthesis
MRWLVPVSEYEGLTPDFAGIGRRYAALLPALVRAGADVEVVVVARGARLTQNSTIRGVRIRDYADLTLVSPLRRPAFGPALVRRHYLDARPSVVFAPEWEALCSFLPRTAPLVTNLATGRALLYSLDRSILSGQPFRERAHYRIMTSLESRQIKRSKAIVPISEAILAWYQDYFAHLPPSRVVRNCIDVDAVRTLAHSTPPPIELSESTSPSILFVGRLERRKGIVSTFNAFRQLVTAVPRARLILAGRTMEVPSEPTRADLLALLPPSLHAQVTFLGNLHGAALYAAMHAATVGVCPSLWEAFGNAALELKASGTPLIATRGSGFDDFCTHGHDSLLVPPNDPAALAQSLTQLLTDPPLRARLAVAATSGMLDYSADAVATALRSAVQCLLWPSNGAHSPIP